eukprot:364615-Chlamydomonas_euryale.AAC.32
MADAGCAAWMQGHIACKRHIPTYCHPWCCVCYRDTVVGLTDRAVHPLFLAAVAQLEVVINGKKVKLGDLKTFEVWRSCACACALAYVKGMQHKCHPGWVARVHTGLRGGQGHTPTIWRCGINDLRRKTWCI